MKNRETICAVVRDLLPSYLDGLTEGATNSFVEQHLAECAECRTVKRNMLEIASPAEQAQAEFLERLRHARERGKRRAQIIALSVALILAVCFLPLPRSVNQTVQAVQWRTGHPEQGSGTVEVRMQGIYMDFLFFDDYFDGDIMIEGVDISCQEGVLSRVRMDTEGYLVYRDDQGLLRSEGFIIGPGGFDQFVIGLYDSEEGSSHGSWAGDDGTVITWPAVSREEAVERTKQIVARHCTWLAQSRWEGGQMEP